MLSRPCVRCAAAAFVALAVGTSTLACAANVGVAPPSAMATAAIQGPITMVQATAAPTLTPPPMAVTKLNVNTASVNEMRAAFAAVGILGAVAWAAAIEDARPYPADDVSWLKLRAALSKAGAPSTSVEQIIVLLVR